MFNMTVRPRVGLSKEPITRLRQKGVINAAIELGRTLQVVHPEIAELYRQGYTQQQIAEELVSVMYATNKSTGKGAVHFALAGYKGHLDWVESDGYSGLLSDEERDKIDKEHKQRCGHYLFENGIGAFGIEPERKREIQRKIGQKHYEQGTGIFSMTTEQKRALGRSKYINGVGVHGKTHEQLSEYSRKGALARGQKLWSNEEVQYVQYLVQQPEYQHQDRLHKGSPNQKLIAEKVNEVFHQEKDVRTAISIRGCLRRYK